MTEARVVDGVWSESATFSASRPGWWQSAKCHGRTDLFFAPRYDGPRPSRKVREQIGEAKALCQGCSVRNICLEFALDSEEWHGIWGGLTPRERNIVRRRAS